MLPLTTSNRLPVCDHGKDAGEEPTAGAPASAYTDAMIGEEALVPPKTVKPVPPKVTLTATPVRGSATADTSALALRAHWVAAVCQAGLGFTVEQPLPAPLHAVSFQPRALASRVSEVPPTAVTCESDAGYSTPKPSSPVLAVTATPGWLYAELGALSPPP